MGVKYFVRVHQICAYLGSNSAFLAPGPKPAGGWHIHGHTCWVRGGGLITGWKKWYGDSVQLLQLNQKRPWCTMCLLPEDTEESLWFYSIVSYKLDLISIQTCTHIPKSLGWACCDFPSWNWIAIHYCTYWHHNSILSSGQLTEPQIVSMRKCKHSRCPHHVPIILHAT